MFLGCMELWAGRCKQTKSSLLFYSSGDPQGWSCSSHLHFPKDGILNGKKNSRYSLGLVWPGRSWQSYFSLGVLEAMDSEAEACHSSKIVLLFNKKLPFLPNPLLWNVPMDGGQQTPTLLFGNIVVSTYEIHFTWRHIIFVSSLTLIHKRNQDINKYSISPVS